ncbi:bile acid:sodium symporter [Xenorhabdus sp. 42]|uniref:bile acid:sodium symporter family protein n=1 Tax=Xenorhabdus szentirmaii TaxID=290112 RepID=UPI001983B158|nr:MULTISPECIES: bile acid:sodium symporter family protein [unclassified Xenorhabdus]MBD2793345.1 bile acid:sodium symporter [Xenorhabdus sp. CUL]MBD2806748.1 bile acid:sodium symporter [Xenorhabdus sp. ZM]MBD2821240.1 bile acid:sodium symporter [Xenorhabdus sp. 42]
MNVLQKLKVDSFLVILISVVVVASFFPCEGEAKKWFQYLTTAAIALLFFMHGAKLSRNAILAGIGHWRLHLVIFISTFVLFPVLGMGLHFIVPEWMSPTVYMGFLYLCALPATVQSAIAFTSVAGGNVAAAICSASASSLLGVFLSPLLVSFLIQGIESIEGEANTDIWKAIKDIILQLMVPFVIGHLSRPLIAGWVEKHKKLVNMTDRSSILLVVYVAFSEAVVEGIWHKIDAYSLVMIGIVCCLLLAIVLAINVCNARLFKFSKEDEITIVFCGSKKSLANGVPMANVLFPAPMVGIMLLPLMIFHQIQLMVCAVLAQRYARSLKSRNKSD